MDEKKLRPLEELLDEVRDIDGFPSSEDEDLAELSDPPYYTACPNPYLKDFFKEHVKNYDQRVDEYDKKPFVGDVSEGKNDTIYNAHSYHTKVPYKAIMKFIEHYTEPGDIILDGFCGSGMTGVAAHLSNRRAIISDISPVASFIAYNYNKKHDLEKFESRIGKIIEQVKEECGWMFTTTHTTEDGNSRLFEKNKNGIINYVVWSDIFICPYCSFEYVFWDAAVDHEKNKVNKKYNCPKCHADLTKRECERVKSTYFDSVLNKEVEQIKQVPVLINYFVGRKRFFKIPDKKDVALIEQIMQMEIPYWFPTNRMPEGSEARRNDKYGYTHVHHFYTKRNLWVLSSIFNKMDRELKIGFLSISATLTSKLVRYNMGNRGNGSLAGTLYISSLNAENNPLITLKSKMKDLLKAFKKINKSGNDLKNYVSCNSISELQIPDSSVDYIFTDPPFGDNLMYSELNYIWESWIKVITKSEHEAVVNEVQNKDLRAYTEMMSKAFEEMYRVLKPNRWITVVFHNSKASVWNAIQESISRAGFIIAWVSTMDKKQGSYKQVTSTGAVKNDLIINAYKPNSDFVERFLKNAGEEMEVDFIKQQLGHLPIEISIERTENMLYSKMLAHYVENGFKIKYNARTFYQLLLDNFVERDGYWFLEDQAKQYDGWKSSLKLDELEDIKKGTHVLFVLDEKSALTWLYNFLDEPKDYSEIYTNYEQVATRTDDEIPELKVMLDRNFIKENGNYRRPISKQEKAEIAKNRERELDKAWKDLLDKAKNGKRKIKNVHKEALVHGFTKCYQEENYQDILTVADSLYTSTLESSGDIMDFVDIARIKLGG